jgi:predicted oxidoreductase
VELRAQAVVVTSGGIGGNHDLVRANWPARARDAADVDAVRRPATVDGPMLWSHQGRRRQRHQQRPHVGTTPMGQSANHSPGLGPARRARILPGPSSLWLVRDRQHGCPVAAVPPLRHPRHRWRTSVRTGHESHLVRLADAGKIVEKEFALSGSES